MRFFIPFLLTIQVLMADCWFGCDSTDRNISTDIVKVKETLKSEKFQLKTSKENISVYCNYNYKNELRVVKIYNKGEKLIVTFSQFKPPKIEDNKWSETEFDSLITLKVMKALDFGIKGIWDKISEDKRCIKSITNKDNEYITCEYSKDAKLPPELIKEVPKIDLNECK